MAFDMDTIESFEDTSGQGTFDDKRKKFLQSIPMWGWIAMLAVIIYLFVTKSDTTGYRSSYQVEGVSAAVLTGGKPININNFGRY